MMYSSFRQIVVASACLWTIVSVACFPCFADEPATAEVAAKVLDLRKWEVPKDVISVSMKSLGTLMYEVPGKPKPVFTELQAKFKKAGWKELPNAYISDDSASCHLMKEGFRLSLSTSAGYTKPGESTSVYLGNVGNVDPKTLPVPKGLEVFNHSSPADASYLSDIEPAKLVDDCAKLLTEAGWAPYGSASQVPEQPMLYFRKNAIRIMVWGSKASGLNNRTMLRLSTELLTADIPMFPGSDHPDYRDTPPVLNFSIPNEKKSEMFQFYADAFTKAGWKATTEQPVEDADEGTGFQIFRNAANDMMSVDIQSFNDKTDVSVTFSTEAEVEEMDKRAKELAEQKKAQMEKENQKTTVSIPAPPGAKSLEVVSEQTIEYVLPAGKGKAAFDFIRKKLVASKWTEDEDAGVVEEQVGQVRLKKGEDSLDVSFDDIGFSDAEVRVSGSFKIILKGEEPKKSSGSDKKDSSDKKSGTDKKPGKKNSLIPDLPPGVELPKDAADLLKQLEKDE
ncbi:MAG: hypothetical protein JNL58_01945 [Planctomyces sp.]|nr:hypothetical protein [Planctomyces sp.]